jgi:hypothetical protein
MSTRGKIDGGRSLDEREFSFKGDEDISLLA